MRAALVLLFVTACSTQDPRWAVDLHLPAATRGTSALVAPAANGGVATSEFRVKPDFSGGAATQPGGLIDTMGKPEYSGGPQGFGFYGSGGISSYPAFIGAPDFAYAAGPTEGCAGQSLSPLCTTLLTRAFGASGPNCSLGLGTGPKTGLAGAIKDRFYPDKDQYCIRDGYVAFALIECAFAYCGINDTNSFIGTDPAQVAGFCANVPTYQKNAAKQLCDAYDLCSDAPALGDTCLTLKIAVCDRAGGGSPSCK